MQSFRLDSQIALVTGASSGLGAAIAVALAEAGADVAVAARAKADLEETAHQAGQHGVRTLALTTDVAVYAAVERLMSQTVSALGRLDILVNNAGIARVAALAEASLDDWQAILDVNLSGVFYGCRAAAPHLIRQQAGKVINLASVLAAVALPGYTMYSATKGAVISLTRTLAVEWARHNIQVNAIAPGWFVTEMNEAAFADPRIHERLTRDIPARRTGRLEEIGPLAVYLASPGSEFMTGQTIFLDGGHTVA
jgi:NAD(P)-dependent dehydrogenase (short-subunit alcohol dehydrogenase family)